MVKFYLNNRKKYRLFVGVIFLDFIVIYVINVDVYKMFGLFFEYKNMRMFDVCKLLV